MLKEFSSSLVAVRTTGVVVQQQLRSTTLVVMLSLALALFAIVGVFIAGAVNGPIPQLGLNVGYVVGAALLLLMLLAMRIVVSVVETPEGRALELAYGPCGFVRQRFGPERIESASVQDLSETQMSRWGYRGSRRLLRRASLMTRRGPALQLSLTGTRHFTVTVDDPESFATALLTRSNCSSPGHDV